MILEAATFSEGTQPPIYYPGMPNPPTDRDLKTFIYAPRKLGPPFKADLDPYIEDAVTEVSAKFGLIEGRSEAVENRGDPIKPTAFSVVTEALRRIANARISSAASVRRAAQRVRKARQAEKSIRKRK